MVGSVWTVTLWFMEILATEGTFLYGSQTVIAVLSIAGIVLVLSRADSRHRPVNRSRDDARVQALMDYGDRQFSFRGVVPLVNVTIFPLCPANHLLTLRVNDLALAITVRLVFTVLPDL